MVQGQPSWIPIAVATIPGAVLFVLGWLTKRRIENAQARAVESTAAIDGFDRLVNRLHADLERRDKDLAAKDRVIADLRADLHLVESLLLEERNKRKKST